MEQSIAFTLLGSFISLLLMVNAFFTRKTLEKVSSIELRLVEYTTKHDATEERSRKNEQEITRLKEKLHSVEGGQSQLLQYLKDNP